MAQAEIPEHIPEAERGAFSQLSPLSQQILSKFYVKQSLALKDPKTIEIAGKKILAMPLELMSLNDLQMKKFEELGGLMNPSPEIAMAPENQSTMMYWQESFDGRTEAIDGTQYSGFELWKKVFEAFPEYKSMTEEDARAKGLYPLIHCRNHHARAWMAEMNGGHLAELDKNFKGELRDIYDALKGKTNLEKLASIGQASLGWSNANGAGVCDLGVWAYLASGSVYANGNVRTLCTHRGKSSAFFDSCFQRLAVSSVIVMDK